MKKTLLVLSAIAALALVSCGGGGNPDDSGYSDPAPDPKTPVLEGALDLSKITLDKADWAGNMKLEYADDILKFTNQAWGGKITYAFAEPTDISTKKIEITLKADSNFKAGGNPVKFEFVEDAKHGCEISDIGTISTTDFETKTFDLSDQLLYNYENTTDYKAITKISLNAQDGDGTLLIKSIKLTDKEIENTIYDTEIVLDTTWKNSGTIPASNFADVTADSEIKFYITVGTESYHQIKICDSSWAPLPDVAKELNANEYDCIPVNGDITFKFSANDLEIAKNGGLIIQGYDITVTKVTANNIIRS